MFRTLIFYHFNKNKNFLKSDGNNKNNVMGLPKDGRWIETGFWEDYKSEFSSDGIDDETLEALTRIVLYNVIRRRITIDKVRQGVNL